eukprot:scaffold118284_cov87-Phaeocystis_antarctica.AAC.2
MSEWFIDETPKKSRTAIFLKLLRKESRRNPTSKLPIQYRQKHLRPDGLRLIAPSVRRTQPNATLTTQVPASLSSLPGRCAAAPLMRVHAALPRR